MAKKESGGFFDGLMEKGEKKAKRKAKSKIKKLHAATKAIAVLCLIVGIVAGAALCLAASKKDHFELKGETSFSFNVGEDPYVYHDEGVDAVCFGRDVSGKAAVEASDGIIINDDGSFTIPTDKEGVYTLTYTVDCIKFGEKAPNGVIKRIRVFSVDVVENDGRGDGEEVAG